MRRWTVEDQHRESCTLSLDLEGLWPFAGRTRQTIAVFDDAIDMTIELHSTGQRFPAGVGWHPWFRRDVRTGASPRVQVRSDKVYILESDQIPGGALAPVDAARDLRGFPAITDRRLDDCYSNVADPMRIAWGDLVLSMHSSTKVRHAVVYTPEHAFCLEPQTCAIDAFNLEARGVPGTGVTLVQSGDPLIVATRWRWELDRGTDR
jgi:aldose 1-epimerase